MDALLLLVKVALVFGLLALVLWVLKRTDGLGARSKNSLLEVRGSTRLGKGAALTVVRLDGKDLLLGVTDHTVTLLTSETAPAQPEGESSAAGVPLTALLSQLRSTAAKHHPVRNLARKADVPDDAVAAALATLRGEHLPAPAAADGPAAVATRLAARRRVARTDALRDEEHLWTRACRPAFRAADGDDTLG